MSSLRKLLKSTGRGLQMVLRALSVQKTGHSQLQQRVHPIFLEGSELQSALGL